MTHKLTVESIYHLTCSECHNWWSYAHTARKYDIKLPITLRSMTCPHCGFMDSIGEQQ